MLNCSKKLAFRCENVLKTSLSSMLVTKQNESRTSLKHPAFKPLTLLGYVAGKYFRQKIHG